MKLKGKRRKQAILIVISFLFLFSSLSCSGRLQEGLLAKNAARLHNNQKFEEAIKIYKRLIKMNPNNNDYLWDITVAYIELGKKKSARRIIKKLRKMGNENFAEELEKMIKQKDKWMSRKKKSSKQSQ